MVVLIAGGIGVTPMISIIRDIYCRPDGPPSLNTRDVFLLWMIPGASELSWFQDTIDQAIAKHTNGPQSYPHLRFDAYLTRPGKTIPHSKNADTTITSSKPPPMATAFPGIVERAHAARPNELFTVAVYVCGPSKLANSVWKAVTAYESSHAIRVDLDVITF